jgi:histidinol-phosphate aminotransferase
MEDMNHNLEAILDAINDKTKVIVISNPHNPTGLYIDEQKILNFIKQVPENVLVVIDQAYFEYTEKREQILINEINNFPNLLITRTFSKIYGLAGLRIGYGIAHKEIIDGLKAKWLGAMPSVTSLAVFAATKALDDIEHIEKSREFNTNIKNKFYNLFDKYNVPYLVSEANFVTFNVKDSKKYHHLFREHNIELTPGYFFGYPEWVRTSFIKDSDLQVKRIKRIIDKI